MSQEKRLIEREWISIRRGTRPIGSGFENVSIDRPRDRVGCPIEIIDMEIGDGIAAVKL